MKIQSKDRDVFYIIRCACVTLFIFPVCESMECAAGCDRKNCDENGNVDENYTRYADFSIL